MDEHMVSEGSDGWDDARIARALFASGQRTAPITAERKAEMLQALLAETARLASIAQMPSQMASAAASEVIRTETADEFAFGLSETLFWSDERLENVLEASGRAVPTLNEIRKAQTLDVLLAETARLASEARVSPASASASASELAFNELVAAAAPAATPNWDDARVERTLFESGQRVPQINDARRAELLQTLLAENTKLATRAQQLAPPKPGFLDWLRQIFNPRVVVTMGGTFAVIVATFAYALLGGARPAPVASAQGSFALTETRQGPLGVQWSVPRAYANGATISPGDEVVATSPITLTFADGSKTLVATVGSRLRVLDDNSISLVTGEILASTTANTADDQFSVASVAATFVVTDASFRIKVDETGIVSQFTDEGTVLAATSTGMVEVNAGEQASVSPAGETEKSVQAPVVAGQTTDEGAVAFTARAAGGSTVVVLDSQTGKELATFQADENGIVNGAVVPPPGTTAATIGFQTISSDGNKSTSALAVTNGVSLTTTSETSLPPAPVKAPTEYSIPALSLPAPAPTEATERRGARVTFNVTASDNVDGEIAVNCSAESGAFFGLGETVVTCTATNSQGRSASGTFSIVVSDKMPPVLSLPQNRTVTANGSGATVTFTVTANDTVDGVIVPVCSARSGDNFGVGTSVVNCSATDGAGNTSNGTFVITVRDGAAPSLQLPNAVNAAATGRGGAEVNFGASASDQVDGSLTPVCTPRSGSLFPLGSTLVNCVATDRAGNSTTGSFTVIVRDQTAPSVDVPDALTVQATSGAGAAVNFSASASDAVEGGLSAVCSPRSGTVFGFGSHTVTCRATDGSGNGASRSFTINVVDTNSPTLNLPSTLNASATSANGAAVTFSASATDAVDGTIIVACTPRSGSVFGLGSTTVSCRATDSRGNQSNGSFSVVVKDTTAPVISLPDAITTEATTPTGATVSFNSSARDAVDGTLSPNCSATSGATFPLGKTMVRCSVADKAGNTSSESFLITVQDTKAPVLKLPDSISAKATSKTGASVSFSASASDAVDQNVTPVCSPRSGAQFDFGDTTVTCRATDNSGNTATGSFKVNVLDTTPPVLTMPSNQSVEAIGPTGAPVQFNASATDGVDGAITPVCDPRPGATFGLGTTTVTCRARDEAGNTTTESFRVTVVDSTAPVLSMPSNQTAEATSKSGVPVTFAASASDKVDGKVDPVCSTRSGAVFGLGTTTVTCRVTDKAGNTSSGSFSVIVRDTTGPSLNLPAAINVEATSAAGTAVSFNASANDAVDGSVTPICSVRSGSVFGLGSNSVSCRATDAAGNSNSGSFNVIVADTTAPVLSLPSNITVQANGNGGAAVQFSASASDAVDGAVVVTCSPASGSTFGVGTTSVSCTATDKAGNKGTGGFAVIVADTTPPTLSLPGNINVVAQAAAGVNVQFNASATDNVDGALPVTCSPASGALFAPGSTTVTCSAADKSGNRVSGSFSVSVSYTPPTPTPTPVTPTPTPTPITPTPTPVTPTPTPITPTPTPLPTETPVPPSPTPLPTETPVPPSPTPLPTETPVPPSPTPLPTETPVPSPTTASEPTPGSNAGGQSNVPSEPPDSSAPSVELAVVGEPPRPDDQPTPTPTPTPMI
jgi:hypothetical protein